MTFKVNLLILPAYFFLYSCDSSDGGDESAEQADVSNDSRLGQDYGQDDGVAKSGPEGVKRYRKAAEQGDAEAQFKLGQIYFHGDGVAKNLTEACLLYTSDAADE